VSGLDLFVGIAGILVTVLVVAAMILITPRGQVDVHGPEADSQGSELSPAEAAVRPAEVPSSAGRG
jgi:hypothetical protein